MALLASYFHPGEKLSSSHGHPRWSASHTQVHSNSYPTYPRPGCLSDPAGGCLQTAKPSGSWSQQCLQLGQQTEPGCEALPPSPSKLLCLGMSTPLRPRSHQAWSVPHLLAVPVATLGNSIRHLKSPPTCQCVLLGTAGSAPGRILE